ncbi:metal tolerance protein B isoform X2 [Ziziphus jujuba]|uniref:Metal tolerance protein B isoform X2 n=1 Tax=Ziziphus jujuba TaxID=326968 RepID=A0ABM3IA41_ZIZJJ|nr:metal tolerance protein B isoform X2 [Ziziphus jujuba]
MAPTLLFPLQHDRETQELHHRRLKLESSLPSDSQMEDEEMTPILRTEPQLEIEVPFVSENVLPMSPQLPCTSVCAFSGLENSILESEQRSKSAMKLCGLIFFYLLVMMVEIVGGVKANSLAVITDAGHLLTDVAGFSISLFSVWASGWKATSNQSFGYYRLEVVGALLSVQLIWLISGFLIYEAINRIFYRRATVNGILMFAIAAFGFVINFIMVIWLGHNHVHHACGHSHHDHAHAHAHSHKHGHSPKHDHSHGHDNMHDHNHNHGHKYQNDHESEEQCSISEEEKTSMVSSSAQTTKTLNINIQGAYLHVMVDMIQSIGVMIAGAIIWVKPDWLIVDLVCTLIFSVLSLSTTIPMIKNIYGILMEGAPSEIDITRLENDLKCIKGVQDVHDLHVWALTVGKIVLSCHVIAEPAASSSQLIYKIRDCCERTYRINHVTVQIE